MGYPSGRQIQLIHGDSQAVITQVGATLRTFEVEGSPILWGFDETEICTGGRGQVLAPWPNRLDDGRYEFAGITGVAALDDRAHGCALHGLVRWLPWEIQEAGQQEAILSCWLPPQPAYPFSLRLEVTYYLGDEGLSIQFEASNEGDTTMPFGIGFHPYLAAGAGGVDAARLRIPAKRRLVLNDRGIPSGIENVEDTEYDFHSEPGDGDHSQHQLRNLEGLRLSDCFTDLATDNSGNWSVLFMPDPEMERSVILWGDKAFSHIMCFTGDTLPDLIRRRAVAIEPMTCPPNALRSGENLILIDPGSEATGSWGVRTKS